MITRIDLTHFKCFKELILSTCPLTVLSGENASGKTAVIHSLVLLHQTMCSDSRASRLSLNGSMLRVGRTMDVVDQEYGRHSWKLMLMSDKESWIEWTFDGDRHDTSMGIKAVRVYSGEGDVQHFDQTSDFRHLLPVLLNEHPLVSQLLRLTYLTAERLGPREQYTVLDSWHKPVVGTRGENTVAVLHSTREDGVMEKLRIASVPSLRIRQVEAWMAKFFPGFSMRIQPLSGVNALSLGLRVAGGTEHNSPINTGFGLTQVLPIVVAGLAADQGDLFIVENPEVHLHPAAQSQVGRFLALLASAGIQVIVETHSDHVLNGFRRAVKDKVLPYEDVAVYYFRSRTNRKGKQQPQIESPAVTPSGGIDHWPKGFFDQIDEDMHYFLGWD